MSVGAPKRKVGLVSFSNQVTIIGDGTQIPKVIAGDRLSDMDYLLKETEKIEPAYLSQEISLTKIGLQKQV